MTVAIVSRRLVRRTADVAAVCGAPVRRFFALQQRLAAVATTVGDDLSERAASMASAHGAPLIRFARGPVGIAALESAGRPLVYRVTGAPASRLFPDDPVEAAEWRETLLALAGPGELRLEPFDPLDPELFWLDPYDRRPIDAGRALSIAADVLRHRARTARRSVCCGVTRWKRRTVSDFLDGADGRPVFESAPGPAARTARAASGRVVAWASRRPEQVAREAAAAGTPLAWLEDGFLRSVGLGSAFVDALSLVLDERGIYYDPARPSDLEDLLAEQTFDPRLLARAASLRRRLLMENVTKYNVGARRDAVVPAGRFAVLVPGQVADDASILRGAGTVRTDRDLLAAVRERRPEAFIVYKPHPDVVAGYRTGEAAEADLSGLADAVVVDGAIADLYPQCRALETMTSLAGFEALLRGLAVTTHGQPFYAGWGLTEDLAPHPRRGRTRSLDELVAAALILYPLYRDPVSGLPCGPETALDRIAEARARAATAQGRAAARLRHAYALARHKVLGPIGRWLP